MIFKYTILYVEDVADTIRFYEKAFDCKQGMIHEAGDYGELSTGSTTLAFSSLSLMEQLGKQPISAKNTKPCFEIAFETEDVSSAVKKAVQSGATLIQDTERMPWGQDTAYVEDKNGFLIEICSPIRH